MKYTRKGFFKSIFGGLVAASTVPSLIKAEENIQPPEDLAIGREALRIDASGSVGIGGSGRVGLGVSNPDNKLHVEGIIFHINDRRLEMSGNENGDFVIKWLDVEDHESSPRIMIEKPRPNPFRKSITNDIR